MLLSALFDRCMPGGQYCILMLCRFMNASSGAEVSLSSRRKKGIRLRAVK